ncbi:GntR family transcriptional regulator [Oscillibacter valericigenes]|uniref:GntR family transcriptional regulator n=1 Tax=Oscillibacter valericigenes TaxID=351091 RepID=UPI001F3DE0DB|nr:GntR family transcriptional regulator [Oscillibacter valericigenes]MCF2615763.1 GntR family transcriptional regulator [Oscillibacter valericigenes]
MSVPPESLLELAYQSLKDNILRGVYPAGSKLPVDRLSRQLSISSTPIKGALNRLVAEHLVEQVPRCGYAVVRLSIKDISEVLEIRKMFEIFAIRPAIKNKQRFPAIMHHIEELLDRFDHATDGISFMEALELERDFHLCFIKLCDNERFLKLYSSSWCMDYLFMVFANVGLSFEDFGPEFSYHRKWYNALVAGDAAEYESLWDSGIETLKNRLSQLLAEKEARTQPKRRPVSKTNPPS